MYRLAAIAFVFLLLLYYLTVILYGAQLMKLSKTPFSFSKAVIPFYYWIF